MSRTIIISNRLPVKIAKKYKIKFELTIGGLATGLNSVHKKENSLWLGWCGIEKERLKDGDFEYIEKQLYEKYNCVPVFLSEEELDLFYNCFSNRTLWPLFHHFPMLTEYNREFWEGYQSVNIKFFNTLKAFMQHDDRVWIHDYQLLLLPKMVKDEFPHSKTGFFLHIPFPSFEIFRLLPWREEILNGILGADLVGFHTYDYVRHFLSSARRILRLDANLGNIITHEKQVKVDAFPMGIDYDRYSRSLEDPAVKVEMNKFRKKLKATRRVILSVDRLDYTKGIPHRVKAFGTMLDTYPEWNDKVTLVLIVAPSRTHVGTYLDLKREVDELVSQINSTHGTMGWVPIWYFYQTFDFKSLTALYGLSDILLVTPLRDGMNLIVKEYIATRKDHKGVVILSETAGAASELGEAFIVNPNNIDEIARSINTALHVATKEHIKMNTIMHRRLKQYDVESWANDFLEKLDHITTSQESLRSKKLNQERQDNLLSKYHESRNRLLLLDYDGTLMSFKDRPEFAAPDREILNILRKLSSDERNNLVIISGRDRNTLEAWFGKLPIHIVAGHGVWIRKKGKDWTLIENVNNEWKWVIRPILEIHVNRTPRSFIEEKEYSLAWHYRKCDPDFAEIRVSELKETLLGLTDNLNIGVIDGNKVLEIKDTTINKGRAAFLWINELQPEYILAIGDDWTDEDMFSILPASAYSIKVGYGSTNANYYLNNVNEVRKLLQNAIDRRNSFNVNNRKS